jgi:predicted deacylase
LKTQTVTSFKSPLDGSVEIIKQTFTAAGDKPVKRISFVAGLHGDELEGVYLCHRIIETLQQLKDTQPQAFRGEVHIYPAVNTQALGSTSRLSPFFLNDMNRQMGDNNDESFPGRLATALLDDLQASSDIVMDFHASNLHLRELPQIRIIEGFDKKLIPLAALCNMDLIWVHPSAPVFESTLGYNLNRKKIPALVVETGICLRIHQDFCEQILQGMINLMRETGVLELEGPPQPMKQVLLVNPRQVAMVQANHTGLFVSDVTLGDRVNKGERLGKIIDAVQGKTLETVIFPASGILFTLREQPVTYQGAPLARIALEESSS